jgi:hypothetical protein
VSKVILVDFGASRIKSVLVDTDTDIVIDSYSEPSPSSQHRMLDNKFEVPAAQYWQVFESSVDSLIVGHGVPDAIYICSEMHGFVLTRDGEPLTGYISWKDQRVKMQEVEQYTEQFFQTTGMKLRSGLPFVSMFIVRNQFTGTVRFNTLVDWILIKGGCDHPISNITLAASTGLVNNDNKWSVDLTKLFNQDTQYNKITTDLKECLGHVVISGHSIPVYGGIGDLQSAMYGAGLGVSVDAVLNLGTGSQVACRFRPGTETRPDVNGHQVSVITHIPCGRSLNVLATFVNNIAGQDIFWDRWNKLTYESILSARPLSNINFFEAAWKWNGEGGSISLSEERNTLDLVLPEIARTWIEQYIEAIDQLDPNSMCKQVGVIGGLATKSSFVIKMLNILDSSRIYNYVKSKTGEETLDGLLKASKL